MAPEIFKYRERSKASDVYSFGMLIYEMITLSIPFDYKYDYMIMSKVSQGDRPQIKSTISDIYRDLIEACWSDQIEDRPTFSQIVEYLIEKATSIENIDSDLFYSYVNYVENKTSIRFKKYRVNFDKSKTELTIPESIKRLNLEKYVKLHKLGKGSFAKVYKIKKKNGEETYAAKKIKDETEDLDEDRIKYLSREVDIISKLDNHAIIKFIGYSDTDFKKNKRSIIITDVYEAGNLKDILKLERRGCALPGWDDTKKFIVIYGIAAGMKYLHSKNILHRDLKPENILLDEFLYPKVSDFGLSRYFPPDDLHPSKQVGTPVYMSPEILSHANYLKEGDVYAFALIVYEIVTLKLPYVGNNLYEIAIKVCNKKIRPEFNDSVPSCYKRLIEACWSHEPKDRPTFTEIVELLSTDKSFISDNIDIDEVISYARLVGENFYYNDSNEKQQNKPKKEVKIVPVQNIRRKVNETTILSFIKIVETEKTDPSFKDYFIDLSKFEQNDIILKNEFNKVMKVKQKENDEVFLARISNLDMNQFTDDEMQYISREMNTISQINHPCIVKMIGFSPSDFKGNAKPVVITEFLRGMTLTNYFEYKRKNEEISSLDDTKKLIIIYGIAAGMKHLHSLNIIHRNLKPSNIFLTDLLQPKLSDFGLCSQILISNSMTTKSTITEQRFDVYSAPEVIKTNEYSKSSDVYSFAMIVYEIITRERAFSDFNYYRYIFCEVRIKEKHPKIKKTIPICYRKLIEQCWAYDPKERPTFDEIIDILENNTNFISDNIDKKSFKSYIEQLNTKNE